MKPPRVVRWLHISDLHCPCRGRDAAWEHTLHQTLDRMGGILRSQNPVDLVVVSGDVARTGQPQEYSRASDLLDDIRAKLTRGHAVPVVLATPGDHDTHLGDGSTSSRLSDSATARIFANWSDWWSAQVSALPGHVKVHAGETPGDFAATLTFEHLDLRFGVASINTATGRDEKGRPPRLGERLNAASGGPRDWTGYHHAAIFVSHHPPTRRESSPPWSEVANAGFTVAHCGNLQRFDAPRITQTKRGLVLARAMSLSGYDPRAGSDFGMVRPRGVVLGEVNFDPPEKALLRVWEYDLSGHSEPWLEPVVSRWIAREPTRDAPPEGMPEPLVPAAPNAEDDALFKPSREQIATLLWEVLPDEADFRSFTLTEMPEVHRRLPYDVPRKARAEALLERTAPDEIYQALRRYLPETTLRYARRLRATARD